MKKTLFLLLCIGMYVSMYANERSLSDATAIASQFAESSPLMRKTAREPQQNDALQLVYTANKFSVSEVTLKQGKRTKKASSVMTQTPAFYVFNRANDGGFIIVSADDYTYDVLAYSDQGSFDAEQINPNFAFWLYRLQEQISLADETNAVDKKIVTATTAISPLLVNASGQEIKWDQLTPYNNSCPTDQRDNSKSYTGCVATAMAQIMYKWQWPTQGKGSKTYTWYDCLNNSCSRYKEVSLSANFGATTYDWANMRATYGSSYTTAQANAVATLMYHCGVACEMGYGGDATGGSGAYTDMMGRGAVDYLRYKVSKFVSTLSQQEYEYDEYEGEYYPAAFEPKEYSVSIATLTSYFNADLEAGRPILIGGTTSDEEGHEFVCDGRDTKGYFHINWGWSGDANCYCQLSALRPTGESYSFSADIDALIGLEPNYDNTDSDDPDDPDDPTPDDPTPVDPTPTTGATFVLATTMSDLSVGSQILIVNEDASVAMSTNQKTNNRGQASVTIANNQITLDDDTDVQVLTLENGTKSGTYALSTGDGYLYAASSSSNYLKTQSSITDNGSWQITISSGVASIVAQGTNTHNTIRYNKSNTGLLFAAYLPNNQQQDVAIYVRTASTPSAIWETEEMSRPAVLKRIENGQLLIQVGDKVYNTQGQLIVNN